MKKISTSRKGRVCRYPHCGHVLSIYNHDVYCRVHLGLMTTRQRDKNLK